MEELEVGNSSVMEQIEDEEEIGMLEDASLLEHLTAEMKQNAVVDHFRCLPNQDQLMMLTSLLTVASPEVKYHFQVLIEQITMYDIVSAVPLEVSEKIFLFLDLSSLLKCRQVCHSWNVKISQCSLLWIPFLNENGINQNGFASTNIASSVKRLSHRESDAGNLDVIGEGMKFDLPMPQENETEESLTINSDSYFRRLVLGRKVLKNFKSQACFSHCIDHDCLGSNLVMAMNEEIIAYAREDRHIVVKYTNFPHKKICVFEAHQVADMKILNNKLITGGYNRTICIWYWESGQLYCCLEGSIKPVLSLDVVDRLLVSSDGKSIITWDIISQEMLVKWPCFEDDGIVEELLLVDSASNPTMRKHYKDTLLVTRSYHEIKVWILHPTGTITFLSNLEYNKDIRHLQPYLKLTNHLLSCSSEYGVITWDLVDFSFVSNTDRKPCKTCQFTSDYCRHKRVLLLYHSTSHMLEYYVYGNYFNLVCLKTPSKGMGFRWNYPSHEKWPWAHRKPGMACLITNLEEGFTETTKITMFVATQDKKIYCMVFDAADLEENGDYQLSEVLSGSRTWNSLIDD